MKKKKRRLDNLCRKLGVSLEDDFCLQKQLDRLLSLREFYTKKPSMFNEGNEERIELINLFIELGYSSEDAHYYWITLYWEQRRRSGEYRKKPIPIRKDNPNTYGEKFNGGGTRRQPRKCRKTAWKRFNKLFPEHIVK